MSRFLILGLLRQRPMHGYEIQQFIQQNRMDVWASVLSGSIYYALNKMEEEGLLRTVAEERTGARLRKIYGTTEEGEASFQGMLRELLVEQPHNLKSNFSLAVNWIHVLPKEECRALLEDNLQRLIETRRHWEYGIAIKKQYGARAATSLLQENALAHIELDIQFLQRLIDNLDEMRDDVEQQWTQLPATSEE